MMCNYFILVLWVFSFSTGWYVYLHKKTRVNKKYIYTDNLAVIGLSVFFCWLLYAITPILSIVFYLIFSIPSVLGFSFIIIMIRFWRTPIRKVKAKENEIVSPADGNVIYIKKVEAGDTPVSIKNGLKAPLSEILHTNLVQQSCWLVGINMTPFDVHKNCAPVSGFVVLNKHISGQFLSLKDPKALIRNERNTLVIETDNKELFAIVQTASKLVRRIDSYVSEGQSLKKGEWFGMIRFGSQVDLVLPSNYNINVLVGQQLYAKTSIIAKLP